MREAGPAEPGPVRAGARAGPDRDAGDVRPALAELSGRAEATPEEPFLFFRDARGHFAWWSWSRAAAELADVRAGAPGRPAESRGTSSGAAPEAPRRWLLALAGASDEEAGAARALLERMGGGPARDILLSWRPLDAPGERVLACAALAGGWAVLREPAEPLPASTLAWARPTVLAASAPELTRLAEALEALGPRRFALRWRRRRLARLRAVVVTGGGEVAAVEARWRALGAPAVALSWRVPAPEGAAP